MDRRADMDTVESAQRDISSAIRMGKNTARSAKNLSKAAAKAASGNLVGAAVDVLKDKETMKRVLILLLIPILCFAMLGTFFLYALPVSIFEGVVSYFDGIAEQWNQLVYDGGGSIEFKKFTATIRIGGQIVADAFGSIWDGVKSLFTAESGDDTGSTEDLVSDSAIELKVTQEEDAEKQTLLNKVNACIRKIDARAATIEKAISAQNGAIESAVASHFKSSGGYDYFYVQTSITKNAMSQEGAIQLLSLYTVQTGASLQEMKLSDLMRWLGYYDSWDTGKTTFSLGGLGISCETKTWNGTFIPQYLYEQRKQEIHEYDAEKTDFDSMSCAAVDMLLVVDCPQMSEIPVQKSTIYETHTNADGEEVTVAKTVGTAYLNINIMPRSAASLSNLAGLWNGGLGETQDGFQFNSGYDSGATDPSNIIGSASAVGSGDFLWPLKGYTNLSSKFGYRICPFHGKELHPGVDIPAPAGTPIYAADSGTVTTSRFHSSLGNYVVVNHGNGFETQYNHMTSRAVAVGDVVAKGQVIGYVGTTGSSTGNHLDFRVKLNGTPTDPMSHHYTYP